MLERTLPGQGALSRDHHLPRGSIPRANVAGATTEEALLFLREENPLGHLRERTPGKSSLPWRTRISLAAVLHLRG